MSAARDWLNSHRREEPTAIFGEWDESVPDVADDVVAGSWKVVPIIAGERPYPLTDDSPFRMTIFPRPAED